MRGYFRPWAWVLVVAAAAGGSSACSSDNISGLNGGTGLDASANAVPAEGGVIGGDANEALTDLQIATILHTINLGEIAQAQVALTRSTNANVRAFATRIVTDHTAADRDLLELFPALDAGAIDAGAIDASDAATDTSSEGAADAGADGSNCVPDAAPTFLNGTLSTDGGIPIAQSTISSVLQQQASLGVSQLQLVTASGFDASYISKQIAAHGEALQIIDGSLLPQVVNCSLRAQVVATRTMEAMHLQLALALLNGAAEAGVNAAADAGSDGP